MKITKISEMKPCGSKYPKYWVIAKIQRNGTIKGGIHPINKLSSLHNQNFEEIRLIKIVASMSEGQKWLKRINKKSLNSMFKRTEPIVLPTSKSIPRDSNGECVYGLYDSLGKLLYIGVTNSPNKRQKHHRKDKTFHTLEVVFNFQDRLEAEAFETFAIYHINPPLNSVIKPLDEAFVFSLSDLDAFGNNSDAVPRRKYFH